MSRLRARLRGARGALAELLSGRRQKGVRADDAAGGQRGFELHVAVAPVVARLLDQLVDLIELSISIVAHFSVHLVRPPAFLYAAIHVST